MASVARDLDLTETAVRVWVRQVDIDDGDRNGLTGAQLAELAQLRKENRVLREARHPQAGDGFLRVLGDPVIVFPFIEAEKAERRNVVKACALLEVSRSAFYEWHKHVPSARQLADEQLAERSREVYDESRGTYGWPRVHRALRHDGVCVGRARVARIMRHKGLVGRCGDA